MSIILDMKSPGFDTLILIGLLSFFILSGCTKSESPPGTVGENISLEEKVIVPKVVEKIPLVDTGSKSLSPIDQARERISKKPFGISVSPKDSPVSPEKFTGWHTGTDFEIFEGEEDTLVEIRALCDGSLLMKKWVSGYGGVVVQKCMLEGETVTVLYGHLDLESITKTIDTEIRTGEILGVLGKGYSTETDGERKHLHLSIHKGTSINLRGYVSTEPELRGWIDPKNYLP